MLIDEIEKIARQIPAELKERKGIHSLEFVIAERKVMLSKKKLTYAAKFRLDEAKKELRFTEMLKESGSGFSSGDSEFSQGFGFKAQTYKTGSRPREGSIKEQSVLFGKQYSYNYDFSQIRGALEKAAAENGYALKYQITDIGL